MRIKVANGFVDPVRSYLTRSLIGEIEQTASRYAHPNGIVWIIVVHEKKRVHRSAVGASNDNHRRVGNTDGKVDVGVSAASPQNSPSYRIDVFGLRSSKQGRMWKVHIAELAGVVNMSVIGGEQSKLPSLSAMAMIRDCGDWDALEDTLGCRSGRTAKHPERVGVVLAMMDINTQLRLALLDENKKRKRRIYQRR